MTPLSYDQALSMLLLQNNLNERVDPQWREKQHPWLRAAWLKTAEYSTLMGGVAGWEAHDKQPIAARATLVDIWHYLLSEWLQCKPDDDTVEDAAALLIDVMYTPEKWTPQQDAALQNYTDLLVLADSFAHLCAANIFNVKIFERMLQLTDGDWSLLYRQYVAKNTLFLFRQDNGFKEGRYQWADDERALEDILIEHPGATPNELRTRLAVAYSAVLAQT